MFKEIISIVIANFKKNARKNAQQMHEKGKHAGSECECDVHP